MSRYCVVKTIFTDEDSLIDALMETGNWTVGEIEVHAIAQHLLGYRGDQRAEVANIIIRRKNVGSLSNDLGFVLRDDGSYEVIISEYDSRKYNPAWINLLKGNYAYHRVRRDQESRGRGVSRERVNGRQRVVVTGYR